MDDLPLGVLGWSLVRSERDLARASSVSSAAFDHESLCCADLHNVVDACGIVNSWTLLAGKVAARNVQRTIVQGQFSKRDWIAHNHVSVNGGKERDGRSHEDIRCRRHGGSVLTLKLRA